MSALRVGTLVLAVLLAPAHGIGAEIRIAATPSGRPLAGITIEGEIAEGDFVKFRALALATSGVRAVYLASRGGNFLEAMQIGRLVRALNLEVWVPAFPRLQWVRLSDPANNTCASACFFLYVAGVKRSGSVVGLHRPTLPPEHYRRMELQDAAQVHSWIQARAAEYLAEMGVLPRYVALMMSISSSDLHWLSEDDITRDFEGLIREYDEWFRARCPFLTAQMVAEDERLRQRVLRGAQLTDQELQFRERVDQVISENVTCTGDHLSTIQEVSRRRVLLATLANAGKGSALPDGFGGLKWGDSPRQDMIPVPKSRNRPFEEFLVLEAPRVADREVGLVLYSYHRGGLCRVTLGWQDAPGASGLAQLRAALETAYGPGVDFVGGDIVGWLSRSGESVAVLERPEGDATSSEALLTISSKSCVERVAKENGPGGR